MLSLCATGTDLTIDEWNAWEPAEASQAHRPLRRVIKTHAPAQLAPWIGGVERGARRCFQRLRSSCNGHRPEDRWSRGYSPGGCGAGNGVAA